ncbi:MAG: OmpA family protein [Candidatus Brocadiae bacterium]|nr:OmpA family protein [Candidatus Brocadiia bacterium]
MKRSNSPTNTSEWLCTFADLISLLLTFFVLLVTYSSVNSQKFNVAKGAIQGSLGVLETRSSYDNPGNAQRSIQFLQTPQKKFSENPFDPSQEGDQSNFTQQENQDNNTVDLPIHESEGWKIKKEIFFEEGQTKLPAQAEKILDSICEVLQKKDSPVIIQSYGDSNSNPFHSLQKGALRSYQVWKYMVEKRNISPERISIASQRMQPHATESQKKKSASLEIILSK